MCLTSHHPIDLSGMAQSPTSSHENWIATEWQAEGDIPEQREGIVFSPWLLSLLCGGFVRRGNALKCPRTLNHCCLHGLERFSGLLVRT